MNWSDKHGILLGNSAAGPTHFESSSSWRIAQHDALVPSLVVSRENCVVVFFSTLAPTSLLVVLQKLLSSSKRNVFCD
jgi:hypothetical protein